MVTIGMPVYNGKRWLGEAVRSILEQTYQDWELIVIDDGSTDDGLKICDDQVIMGAEQIAISDARIRVVQDGKHLGIAARLNQMIQMAQGEFFARMDADDVMMPNRLVLQVRFMQEHPDVDVVASSAILIDEEGEHLGVRDKGRIHPTVMGRITWFRNYCYRSECDGCEDWDLWLRTKDKTTFGFIKEPLLYYRISKLFDKKKYLMRRRQGRMAIRMNQDILPCWKYYYLLLDSYAKSAWVSVFK